MCRNYFLCKMPVYIIEMFCAYSHLQYYRLVIYYERPVKYINVLINRSLNPPLCHGIFATLNDLSCNAKWGGGETYIFNTYYVFDFNCFGWFREDEKIWCFFNDPNNNVETFQRLQYLLLNLIFYQAFSSYAQTWPILQYFFLRMRYISAPPIAMVQAVWRWY